MNKKISLFITNLNIGGAEKVLINIANELVSRGYEVDVILINAEGELIHHLDAQVKIVDFKLLNIRPSILKLTRYLKCQNPDVLIAFMWPLTIVAVLANFFAGKYKKTKIIVTEHCSWSTMPKKNYIFQSVMKLSIRLIYPFANNLVTVSDGAKQDLIEFCKLNTSKVKITTIYNPVIGARLCINDSTPIFPDWLDGQHKKILAVGNLKEIKDYITLIKAFKIVTYSKKVKLVILGEGECRLQLERLIKDLKLEKSCFLIGQVNNPEAFYKHADVFVLSSVGEGLPTVIIEALSHGLPIVSTDCRNGPREILADGMYGSLVPVRDVEQIAFAIINSLSVYRDKNSLIARARDFSISKAVDEYLFLLEQS